MRLPRRMPRSVGIIQLAACCLGAAMPRPIVTEPFEPQPVVVTLDTLPAPNTTPSVAKFPKMVSPPDRSVLRAPAGFVVTRYWDGELDHPRWLAITPEGDVLVTETRLNRIRRLRDTDHDGVVD